jgi:hypothetical protein
MTKTVKSIAEKHADFYWQDSNKVKPIKHNRVLANVSGHLGSYELVYWTGKRWMQANIDIPFRGTVNKWCYIKTDKGYCW